MTGGPITARGSSVRISLKVVPRSSKAAVAGIRDGRLVVRVTAPPVDHAANEAVMALLAEVLGVPKRTVTLVSGETSRQKVVEVAGVALSVATQKLALGSVDGRDECERVRTPLRVRREAPGGASEPGHGR